jgi:hypothetical protein
VTRSQYVAAALRLYFDAPGTPARAHRADRRVAADLYRQGVPLDHLAHAIRLATLRTHRNPDHAAHHRVYSLAYYRAVLDGLADHELDPGYLAYVRHAYHQLLRTLAPATKPRLHSRNAALPDSR